MQKVRRLHSIFCYKIILYSSLAVRMIQQMADIFFRNRKKALLILPSLLNPYGLSGNTAVPFGTHGEYWAGRSYPAIENTDSDFHRGDSWGQDPL